MMKTTTKKLMNISVFLWFKPYELFAGDPPIAPEGHEYNYDNVPGGGASLDDNILSLLIAFVIVYMLYKSRYLIILWFKSSSNKY